MEGVLHMRITNVMMNRGMLNSIMGNKQDMNTKFEQYATGQKIQKPSDDPVTAIRSLKYRADLLETEQYVEKNVRDAQIWMESTESALKNIDDILTQLYDKCVAGASDSYETIDRDSMQLQLSSMKEEVYNSLNADDAGRYLFSGYRTNTSVCYTSDDKTKRYTIDEPLSFTSMYEKTYLTGGASYDPTKTAETYKGEAPSTDKCYCMDLTYTDIKQLNSIKIYGNGRRVEINEKNSTDTDAYETEAGKITFLKDTGQLIIPDDMYEELRTSQGLVVNYDKDTFAKGDLRPEMYFDCTSWDLDASGNKIESTKKINRKPQNQQIDYHVNTKQSLTVNVLANEVMGASFARVVDDITSAVNSAFSTQEKIEEVDLLLADSNQSADKIEALETLKEQLNTELTLKKSILRDTFAKSQTVVKAVQDGENTPERVGGPGATVSVRVSKIGVNIAKTSIGSRSARLELIESRLTDLKTSYQTIRESIEGVSLEETMTNYTSALTAYNASLNATGRAVQNSLLDFI